VFKIGDIEIKNKVAVAPMAGISNKAFRLIAHKFGAGIIYTEMISDKALKHQNVRTKKMAIIGDEEGLVSLQLFGADKEAMKTAVRYVNDHTNAKIIDLNVGCPVPKVVKGNGGASLMKDPQLVYELVEIMVKESRVPITVKIRTGWDAHSKNAVEVAKKAEAAGASAIAIHGRTRAQMYSGSVDLEMIKKVKDSVNIPVIGNGDIKTPEDAKMMLDYTNVDAVMVGRALQGNPWLIKQIADYLNTGTYDKEIPIEERLELLKDHALKLIDLKGEKIAILEMRSHAAWYIKGLKGATHVKREIAKVKDKSGLFNIISEYQKYLNKEAN